jgi:hypothetical protein
VSLLVRTNLLYRTATYILVGEEFMIFCKKSKREAYGKQTDKKRRRVYDLRLKCGNSKIKMKTRRQ